MAEFNLLDREAEFLIVDILGNSSYETTASALGEVSRLLDSYEREDINTFLSLYFPKNAEKFSSAELVEGIDKINRYLSMLEEESLELERTQTGIYNQIEYERENLRNLIERATNKLDALRIYSRVGFATFSFLATAASEWLSTTEEGRKRLVVADNSNGAVLPIASERKLRIGNIYLGASSNGSPGDPRNLDRVFQRDSLASLIDSSPVTYFEYTRDGEDGVRLELQLDLNEVSIVNAVTFDLVEYPFTHQAQLVEAYYELENGQWAPWIEVPESLGGERILYLNPVKTKNLRLVLSSLGADTIRTGFNLFSRRSILGIRDIMVHSISYEQQGQLISKRRDASVSTISLATIELLPTVESLFSYQLFARDVNDAWVNLEELATDFSDFVNSNTVQVKVNFNLIPEAFTAADSTIRLSPRISNFENFVATNLNPNQLAISSLFIPGTVGILQWEDYTVGTNWFRLSPFDSDVSDNGPMFRLPQLDEEELKNLRVFVNGREAEREATPLAIDEYTIGKQNGVSFVRLGPGSPRVSVHAWLKPENLSFKRNGATFVATLKHPIVPIRDYIKLEYLTESEGDAVQAFQPDTDLLELDHQLVSDITLNTGGGLLIDAGYTEVFATPDSPRSAFTGTKQYYINDELGIIYLSENSTQRLLVNYKFKDIRESVSYEVFKGTENAPQAISIVPRKLVTYDIEETLGASVARRATAKFGSGNTPEYFTYPFTYDATHVMGYLSHGHIIEGSFEISEDAFSSTPVEVPYIDGSQEFASGNYGQLSLGAGTEDLVNNLTTWTIEDYAFIDNTLGIYPLDKSVFVTEVSGDALVTSAGDWYYDELLGKLTVYGLSLGPDLEIGYWFLDFDSRQPMYSVDYEFGRVFFPEGMASPTAKVRYKVAPYRISYLPGQTIPEFNVDGEFVEIRSSLVTPGRNLTAFYDTLAIESNIEELRNYYSPVLKSINLDIV